MLKKFVTIFPYSANVQLTKDIGQVGNTLSLLGEYDATLVCYRLEDNYSFLQTEAKFLKVDFIENVGRKLFMEKAVLNYIKENALEIDVLHFFKMTKETIYYALYYKKCNPQGKLYIKLDIVNSEVVNGFRYSKKKLFNWFHKQKEAALFKKVDLLTVENPVALDLLKKKYPKVSEKSFLLTNGINSQFLEETFPCINSFEEKENIILAVGRIGAIDKNFELILKAFVTARIASWKLIFVGPVENDFDKKVAEIIVEKPAFKSRIECVGIVEDRKALYEYYNRSKICCLTSPAESFGIVFTESMYFGNYIIGTKGMSAFSYISNEFELGSAIELDSEFELVRLLEDITFNDYLLQSNYPKAIRQIKEKFYWTNIVSELVKRLKS